MITQAVQVKFSPCPRRPRCPRCCGWLIVERWPRGHFESCLNCGAEHWIPQPVERRRRVWCFWHQLTMPTIADAARITPNGGNRHATRNLDD